MNEKDNYINTKTARKILGLSSTTLRTWDKENRIHTIRTPSGQRLYCKKDVDDILGRNTSLIEKKKIVYCRVSSKKQEDDLKRQVDFFRREYPLYTVVTDIGSGINWKRKGLKAILEQSMSGDISEIMVAHRDRLCRFGFELIEFILEANKVKLTILDRTDEQSSRQDIADDILSIIHVYSCRENGKRRYTSKVSKDKNISKERTETDSEEMDRDIEICV